MEIERKFLLSEVPDFLNKHVISLTESSIRQAYIARHQRGVVRIRQEGNEFIFTVKGKGNLIRDEYEITMEAEMGRLLFDICTGDIIEKTRYRVTDERNIVHEIDIFHGKLVGLVLMEVEFKDEKSAQLYIPSLFQNLIEREVTEDPRYANSNLSLESLPK